MLAHCAERADELTATYGNVSKQSVGAIQRSLLQLRSQGGANFFGEPALSMQDFLGLDDKGRGIVNILAADKLMASPKLYATRSEEHTSELQSRENLVCRLLLEKKKKER